MQNRHNILQYAGKLNLKNKTMTKEVISLTYLKDFLDKTFEKNM